jgi:hypothetical protein
VDSCAKNCPDQTTCSNWCDTGNWDEYEFKAGESDCDSNYDYDKLCNRVAVPTLTEWGMIILVLLIMAAGTVVIIRKRRVMAR